MLMISDIPITLKHNDTSQAVQPRPVDLESSAPGGQGYLSEMIKRTSKRHQDPVLRVWLEMFVHS